MKLAKARLKDNEGHHVEFQFNPDNISFTKSAKWREQRTQAGEDGPVKQFEGTDPINLTLDLLIDDAETGKSRVPDDVNLLASWTNPTANSISTGEPEAPELEFEWGKFEIGTGKFACHLISVAVDFTMFRPDGVPVRAKVKVELASAKKIAWRQNPTSGGIRPQRRHVLQRGDRLGVIASREYGDAGYWRQIADFNGLQDPFNLPIGRQLLLPAMDELTSI